MFLQNSWMHSWQFSLQTFIGLQLFTSCVTSVHGTGMFTMGSLPHGPVNLQKKLLLGMNCHEFLNKNKINTLLINVGIVEAVNTEHI
jgi:hypothetical protein